MARGTIVSTLRVLLQAVYCATTIVHGTEWTVGDDKGWIFGISGWENRKRIQFGNVLVFKYNPSMHNVVQVGEGDYNSCTVSGSSRTYTSGNDHIQLARRGKAFFICNLLGHCQQGMKIAVTA